jgi:hypothetical protein
LMFRSEDAVIAVPPCHFQFRAGTVVAAGMRHTAQRRPLPLVIIKALLLLGHRGAQQA